MSTDEATWLVAKKIQDQWESVVYEVVQCLDKVGTLYKFKPKKKYPLVGTTSIIK